MEANTNTVFSQYTYLQVLPIVLVNGSKRIPTNAILDSGSDSTLIREDVAAKLNLQGKNADLQITNVLTDSTVVNSKTVNFEISSTSTNFKTEIKNAQTVADLKIPLQWQSVNHLKQKYDFLKDPELPQLHDTDVTVLIGVDSPLLHLQEESRIGKKGEPVAIKTPLGWVLFGGKRSISGVTTNNLLRTDHLNESKVTKTLEKFWTIDSYPTLPDLHPDNLTISEKTALEILENTTKKVEGHFEIGLLWKNNQISLPDNRELAVNRMISLEKRFRANSEFANMYRKQISEYVDLGHARKLSVSECQQKTQLTNYIPHHGVTNPNKPGKVCVIFDAAARYKNNSLNENLLVGPDLLNNLVTILSRF